MRHDYKDNCPITGRPIPNGFSWTDHSKEGPYNSCLSCCPDNQHKSIGAALHDLNERRGRES